MIPLDANLKSPDIENWKLDIYTPMMEFKRNPWYFEYKHRYKIYILSEFLVPSNMFFINWVVTIEIKSNKVSD